MRDAVIDLIPSNALKRKLNEIGFPLSEADLLRIIFCYATDYAARLTWLGRFAETATPAMAAYALRCVEWQKTVKESFFTPEAGMIYELTICETPDESQEYAEAFLCTTVEAAANCADLFWTYYADIDCRERPETRYYVKKRRVSDGTETQYADDCVGEAVFGAGKNLLTVEDYRYPCPVEPACDRDCQSCAREECFCIADREKVEFPQFLPNRSLVRYTELNGRVCYALYRAYDSETTTDLYVYPLDHEIIRNHRFEDLWETHEHAEPPLVEPAQESELTEEMRADLHACLAWIEAHDDID